MSKCGMPLLKLLRKVFEIIQLTILLLFLLYFIPVNLKSQVPLLNGHAHNDYEHERPLFDALDLGYTSIEVDIHFFNQSLRVSHDDSDLENQPCLKELYLEPLQEIIIKNNGTVFKNDSTSLVLMIDFKTKKKKALKSLSKVLDQYDHFLTKQSSAHKKWGPIQIVLSGDPPLHLLKKLNRSYFYIDGRFGTKYPSKLKKMVARVSSNWSYVDELESQNEKSQLLIRLVKSTKSKDQKIRFWATKDHPEIWTYLLDHGVDWISVDDLKGFATFRKKYVQK